MKDIVEYIVKQFVSNPDAVEVTETQQDGYLNISLKVAPDDMGLTIGKRGQTIKAIRRLLTIKAITENVRVNLELVDSGTPPVKEGEESKEKTSDSTSETSEENSEEKIEASDEEAEQEATPAEEKTEEAS